MSIFGRLSHSDAVRRGVDEAVADALSARFGIDPEEEIDLDLEDDPEGAVAIAELEFDLDDEQSDPLIEDIILGLDDDEILEEDVQPDNPAPPPVSARLELADRVRYGGVKGHERKLSRFAKKQEKLATKAAKYDLRAQKRDMPAGALEQLLVSAIEGAVQAGSGYQSAADAMPVDTSATTPWWQHLVDQQKAEDEMKAAQAAQAAAAQAAAAQAAPQSSVTVEAGSETLPPTFVADDVAVPADAGAASAVERTGSFGSTVDVGLVGRQHRPRAQRGAQNAVTRSMQALSNVPYGAASAFIEDANADPVLLSDGRIIDEVYGEMLAVPCPSCARLERRSAFAGLGDDCAVCDGYGAVLMPQSDVPSYCASEAFGVVPIIAAGIGAAVAGAQALGAAHGKSKHKQAALVAEKKGPIMQRLLKKRAEAQAAKAAASAPAPSSTAPESAEGDDIDAMFSELDAELDEDTSMGAIDAWAEEVFGASGIADDDLDLDFDLMEDDDLLDDLFDDDDEASSIENASMVRAMIPMRRG